MITQKEINESLDNLERMFLEGLRDLREIDKTINEMKVNGELTTQNNSEVKE